MGSITGNTNTVGGGAVWPKASLGDFEGMVKMANGEAQVPMIDGNNFNGAKAYKDSKLWYFAFVHVSCGRSVSLIVF